MPQRNLLLLIVAIAISCICYAQGRQDPYVRFVAEGLATVETNSLDRVPSAELFTGAVNGMVDVLRQHGDQHSQFLNRAASDRLRDEIHQRIAGIGVRVGTVGNPPQLVIAGPIEASTPATRAKLQPGDRLLQISDKTTSGMSRHEAAALLAGDRGTSVRLQLQRGDATPKSVELVREFIPTESVLGDRRDAAGRWVFSLEDAPSIGYFRIVSFGDRTAADFADAAAKFPDDSLSAIVLDLRNNTGGALGAAVALCEMLLSAEKQIVETRGRDDELYQQYQTKTDGEYCKLPIAVIVNDTTASAAEIVAAALQDHQRAVVVGQRTFGKGTVQQLLPMESGKSLLKLTWAGFRRPSGANIHRAAGAPESATWGVLPDPGYECAMSAEDFAVWQDFRKARDERDLEAAGDAADSDSASAGKDAQLELATQYLRKMLSETPQSAAGSL